MIYFKLVTVLAFLSLFILESSADNAVKIAPSKNEEQNSGHEKADQNKNGSNFKNDHVDQSDNKNKPILVEVITSLSCNHCAHKADEIKKMMDDLQEQGLIRVQWVDYPPDLATLTATKLSWSQGEEKRYELYRHFLSKQEEWHNTNWRENLKRVAQEAGLDDKTIQKAFEEESDIEHTIVDRMQKIVKRHSLQFVPMLIVDKDLVIDVDESALKIALKKVDSEKNSNTNDNNSDRNNPSNNKESSSDKKPRVIDVT